MKIQKKILMKWQIQQPLVEKHHQNNKTRSRHHHKSQSFGNIFGLPKSILQEPKLSAIKMMIKAKNNTHKSFLDNGDAASIGKLYPNKLRNTLMNRTKEIFRPLKKHASVLETIKLDQGEEILQEKRNKKALIATEHSSSKTLDILQKIIFKEVDFYAKEKTVIELQANKLPIIDNRESKRKQSLAAYETKVAAMNGSGSKYETMPVRSPKTDVRRQEKPYFSGWEVSNDF